MTSWSLVLQQPEMSFRKSAITGDNKNNDNNLITTHNYLHFILKFKLHMLGKISIIAVIENTMSSCVLKDRRLYVHHWLVAKLPITIKNVSIRRMSIYSQRIRQVQSVSKNWSPSLPAIGN